MSKKKNGKSIILPTAGKQENDSIWELTDDEWDEDEDDWDEDDGMEEMSQELFNAMMNRLFTGGENSGGMTNEQYKGMLLDQLENWKRVKRYAEEEGAKKTASECQLQISLINKKLKF